MVTGATPETRRGVIDGYRYALETTNGLPVPGRLHTGDVVPRDITSMVDVVMDPGGLADPQLPSHLAAYAAGMTALAGMGLVALGLAMASMVRAASRR